jgi:short-subunit dehydrogenase
MTINMKFPKILTINKDDVAKDIYFGFKKGKEIVYSRWYWRYIMLIIKMIPEKIFKKMNL